MEVDGKIFSEKIWGNKQKLNVEQYEIVATLDSHTSDICRNLDEKHFPMKDFKPGSTAPALSCVLSFNYHSLL